LRFVRVFLSKLPLDPLPSIPRLTRCCSFHRTPVSAPKPLSSAMRNIQVAKSFRFVDLFFRRFLFSRRVELTRVFFPFLSFFAFPDGNSASVSPNPTSNQPSYGTFLRYLMTFCRREKEGERAKQDGRLR